MVPMRAAPILAGLAVALGSGACGGTAVVDTPGSGGAGGKGGAGATTTTASSSTSASGVAGGGGSGGAAADPCPALLASFEQALAAARACDPFINMIQCTGDAVVLDQCGCKLVANEHKPEAVAAALAAFDAWVNAGCGPYDCMDCPPWGMPACIVGPDGQTGVCDFWYQD